MNPKRLAVLIAIALGGYIYFNINDARGSEAESFGNNYDVQGTGFVFEEMTGNPDPVGNRRSKEDTLQDMAAAYVAGNLGEYAGTFASDANHNGDNTTDVLFEYHKMFRDTADRKMELHDVVIADDGSVTAWVVVSGRVLCGGPVDIEFDHLGYIDSMGYNCYLEEAALAPSMDLAVTGQAADVATTAVGLLAGLSEANPIVGGLGLPIAAIAKLAIAEYSTELDTEDCRAVKDVASTVGWGAAGWNLCALATAATGGGALIPCAIVAGVAGGVAFQESELSNLMICRAARKGEHFDLIDHTGVYRTHAAPVQKEM